MKKNRMVLIGLIITFLIGYQSALWIERDRVEINDTREVITKECTKALSLADNSLRLCVHNVQVLMMYADIRPVEHVEVCRQCHRYDATYITIPMTHAEQAFVPILF